MAWTDYIQYEYPIPYLFHKMIAWISADCHVYFALKLNSSDSWTYYAGDGSHDLLNGKLLTSYGSSDTDAQTNYFQTARDTNGKVLAVLPINVQAKYVRIYIGIGTNVTVHEFRPSVYFSAHEIISGELTITDELSDSPLITVTSASVDRVKIGNFTGSTYGIVGYDDNSATIFELSDNQQMIGGFYFDNTSIADNTSSPAANVYIDSADTKIRLGPSSGNYINIDGANQKIQSSNYVSGMAGAGFTLDPDLLEVGNIAARGIIRTAVFQKDVVNVVNGNFVVLPGDCLATNMLVDD